MRGLSKKLGEFSIKDISFEVVRGEYFVLLGASGAGKTVLLETLTGIIHADSGRIKLHDLDITDEKIQKRKIALVFQDQALFPHLSVRKNIAYGLHGSGLNRDSENRRVERLAAEMEISDLLERKPDTLSGGEAQRVALARALASDPECLLLDEPLSSLDSNTRTRIRGLLRKLNRGGVTMIHVTHDYEEAVSLASRIGVMESGTIVQIDTPEKILRYPKSEFVAGFVGIRNFFRGRIEHGNGSVDGFEKDPVNGSAGVSASGSVHGSIDASAEFLAGGIRFSVLTEIPDGDGFAIIRSEDVTVSVQKPSSSARNVFEGTVTDICGVRYGVEVIIDAGEEIAAVITCDSANRLGIRCGSTVFASIKASAVRILEV